MFSPRYKLTVSFFNILNEALCFFQKTNPTIIIVSDLGPLNHATRQTHILVNTEPVYKTGNPVKSVFDQGLIQIK